MKFKREKVGSCNLCQKNKSLTWDHVPPRGGIVLTPVEQQTIFQHLVDDPQKRSFTISQNGVKYRTLCGSCNNMWLGKKYDPALNKFAIDVGKLINTKLSLPPVIHVEAKPLAIIKAVLGHLVAAKADIDNEILDVAIRNIFFDEDAPIPDSIHVFYWIYPYSSIIVHRDFAMPAIRGDFNNFGVFSVLKYFPIAYLMTDLKDYEGLSELTIFRNCKLSESTDLPISLHKIYSEDWPDKVDTGNFILASRNIQSSVRALPRRKES
jgi:hypothetical protein